MNAGRILRDAGYDSEELRDVLGPIDPDVINVWPASRRLRRLWRSGVKGVTQGRWIFVDPEFLTGDKDKLARLVVHELVHVRQFAEMGYLRFMLRYIGEYWSSRLSGNAHRDSYLGLAAEREARAVTEQMVQLRQS